MKTQTLTINNHNDISTISATVKAEVATKVALFTAILACVNMIAFF